MANISKSVAAPNLRDVLNTQKESIFGSFNCHSIGRVESFNTGEQTAEIQLVFNAVFEGKSYQYPLLVDCPVVILGGSTASLQLPVKQGDECLVLFNDVDIDNWFQGGSTISSPDSNRKHDLSDGIALVGLRNLEKSITDFDNDVVRLINGDSYLTLANGTIVDLNNGKANLTFNDKINLGNLSSDIKTILENLIDQVKAIVTLGSPTTQTVSPASQAALEALKTEIGAVFE